MDAVIHDFIHLLRRHSIRVSPAESLDALCALRVVGLGEREVVRDTLRATLIKSTEDIAAFDRLFELYFGRPMPAEPRPVDLELAHDHGGEIARVELGEDLESEAAAGDDHPHSHEAPEATNLRRFFDEARLRPASELHGDPESLRLSLFAQELVLNRKQGALEHLIKRITHQLRVRRARNIFNPGGLALLGESEELPIDISVSELQDLVDHLHELAVDEALIQQVIAQTDSIVRGLPELLKALLERRRRLDEGGADVDAVLQRSLRRLLNLSAAEQRDMEAALRRLARQIHGATTRRQRRDRTGRINVSRTLRHNLRYDGVPFQPVLRRRREQRPRLVLLCDVSLSTRNLARFWLHMVHQMQSLFSKVRTFAFVAETVEVTHLFEQHALDRAVETIFRGQLLDVDANSDFGRAADQFRDAYLAAVNRRTTVVILGDGRNNGRPPNQEALEEIARHARRVIWMTPEPKWGWSLGSCDMPLYAPLCSRVEVVRTVEQLASVAEELGRACI
jgi:uncharacterized protein